MLLSSFALAPSQTAVYMFKSLDAVAALSEMACVVLPEDIVMEPESLEKATSEGMCVISSPLTAYEICGKLAGQGIPAHG